MSVKETLLDVSDHTTSIPEIKSNLRVGKYTGSTRTNVQSTYDTQDTPYEGSTVVSPKISGEKSLQRSMYLSLYRHVSIKYYIQKIISSK